MQIVSIPLVSLWTAPDDHHAANIPPKSLGYEESRCYQLCIPRQIKAKKLWIGK